MANESKTIVQQLADEQIRVAELEATVKGLTGERDRAVAEAAEAKKALTAANESKAAVEKALADATDAHKAEVSKLIESVQAKDADCKNLAGMLRNPAFMDAALVGRILGVSHDGGSVQGGGGAVQMTKAEALKAYNALQTTKEKAEFRKAHAAELELK